MKIYEILNEDICAPQAIARALGLPYDQVMDTCVKFKLWRKRFGMRPVDIIRAIKQLGWEIKDRVDLTVVKKYAHNKTVPYHSTATLNQVLQRLEPNKKYIISLKNHTIAYVDGRVIDDESYGKKHKVTNVLEIIPKNQIQEITTIDDLNDQNLSDTMDERYKIYKNDLSEISKLGSFIVKSNHWPMSTNDYTRFYFVDQSDNPVGYASISPVQSREIEKLYQIKIIYIKPQLRRRGFVVSFYKFLLDNGYSLISDIEQTVGSKMVWQKLIGQYDLYLTDMSDQPVKKIEHKRDFEQAYTPKSGYSKIIAT